MCWNFEQGLWPALKYAYYRKHWNYATDETCTYNWPCAFKRSAACKCSNGYYGAFFTYCGRVNIIIAWPATSTVARVNNCSKRRIVPAEDSRAESFSWRSNVRLLAFSSSTSDIITCSAPAVKCRYFDDFGVPTHSCSAACNWRALAVIARAVPLKPADFGDKRFRA